MNFEQIALLLPKRIRPGGRFLRFLLVGGINTAFGYCAFLACLWLGMHYTLAVAVATVLGVLFNFKSTGTLVFNSSNNRRLPRFIGVYTAIYLVNVTGIAALLRCGVSEWLGGLILILPCAILSYILNSRYVFSS